MNAACEGEHCAVKLDSKAVFHTRDQIERLKAVDECTYAPEGSRWQDMFSGPGLSSGPGARGGYEVLCSLRAGCEAGCEAGCGWPFKSDVILSFCNIQMQLYKQLAHAL